MFFRFSNTIPLLSATFDLSAADAFCMNKSTLIFLLTSVLKRINSCGHLSRLNVTYVFRNGTIKC